MPKCLLLATLTALPLATAGCAGDSRSDLARESAAVMTEVADLLDGIHDAPSSQAARPRLEQLGRRMKAVRARTEALRGEPTESEREAMARYAAPFARATGRFVLSAMRLSLDAEGRAALAALDLGGRD